LTFVSENSYRIADQSESFNSGPIKLEEHKTHLPGISISSKLIYSEEMNLFNNNQQEKKEDEEEEFSSSSSSSSSSFEIKNYRLLLSQKNNSPNSDLKQKSKQKSKKLLNAKLYKNNSTKERRYLIVMTQNKLISLPAQFCKKKTTPDKCKNNIYPYCYWSEEEAKCKISEETSFVQNKTRHNKNSISKQAQNMTHSLNSSSVEAISYRMIANKLDYSLMSNNYSDAENDQLKKNSTDCDLTSPASESIIAHNNGDEMTISMSVYLLLLIIFVVLLISFTFGILVTYNIYGKFMAEKFRQKMIEPKTIDRKYDEYFSNNNNNNNNNNNTNNKKSQKGVDENQLNSSSCFMIDFISGLNKNETLNGNKVATESTKDKNKHTCKKFKSNKKKAINYMSMSSSISSQPSNVQSHVGFMIGACSCSSEASASCQSSSSSSESHSPTITKSTDLSSNQAENDRYVYLNNKSRSNLPIVDPINHQKTLSPSLLANAINIYNENHKFMDYDHTEYFSLRRNKTNYLVSNHYESSLANSLTNAQHQFSNPIITNDQSSVAKKLNDNPNQKQTDLSNQIRNKYYL
jgi:hypothetical protein